MPDGAFDPVLSQPVMIGSIDWLNKWVGHARPGARQMIGPVAMTYLVDDVVGQRVQALVGAKLLIAAWKAAAPSGDARWEWHLVRTGREVPAAWPLLVAPKSGTAAAPKARRLATDVVFEKIKAAALGGHPSPSNEDFWAACDVSSIEGVRDVLRRLERDGLIAVRREKGLRVFGIPALGIETERAKA
jgi:hypothetical protein